MTHFENTALKAFVEAMGNELVFAQVLIRRAENGFQICHVADRNNENLRTVSENEIRELAQFTETGAFRPLKSAPNLRSGWKCVAPGDAQLEFALNTIYPGAMADWFAVRFSKATPTQYREFTKRQTGMYRITTMLTDEQVAPVIRACCDKKFCLKHRLWTIDGLKTDSQSEKSLIPCLEPCAMLLEFARKAMRLEQQETSGKAEEEKAESQTTEIREADFENPKNPRRLQLALEKQKGNP